MAVAMIQEFAIEDHSTATYDAIAARVRSEPLPDALLVHTAGFDDEVGVFRIFDVYASREEAEAFQGRVMALVADLVPADAPAPTRMAFYELHDVVMP